jgi:phospholipid/cholesterol/gamma-HCH transport system substrate-binding protein
MNPETPEVTAAPVAHLELKAALLLALMVLLLCGSVVYVLYARGAFEATQQLVLVADDSEGVLVGMDLTFSGFPIGRVRRIDIAPDGKARIAIDLPRKDAHWLRESSVFTLSRGLVGGTNLRAYTGIPSDPPLADGAERKVLVGDATSEIPQLVAQARSLVQNLTALTAPESALALSLANVQTATAKLAGPQGALGLLLGNEADARKLVATIERSNALLARLDRLAANTDALLTKADAQVFGAEGVMRDVQATVLQLNTLLGDARATLTKVDAVLEQAQGVAANVRGATTDLGPLRSEVEANLRRVQHLLDEVNRKWPFARDTEIRLP